MFIAYFWNKFCKEFGKDIPGFRSDALHALKEYSWPGNIRELENAVKRAIIDTKAPSIITLDSLPDEIKPIGKEQRSTMKQISARKMWWSGNQILDYNQFESRFIDSLTRDYLEDVLSQSDGNISKVAQLIKIDRTTLTRKLDRLGIKYTKN